MVRSVSGRGWRIKSAAASSTWPHSASSPAASTATSSATSPSTRRSGSRVSTVRSVTTTFDRPVMDALLPPSRRLGDQEAQVVGTMDQVHIAPLLRGQAAEERRRVQLPRMVLKPPDDLLEPGHGGGLVAAGG